MWTTRYLEWDGVRFPAQALASEAVSNPKLSALPAVLRIKIDTGPEIFSLDIQAWIRETEAPVFTLRGMLDVTDNWHFGRLVAALQNGYTYALVEWEDQGQILDRLLLAPLNESLVCAAFIDSGIPKRPRHQQPKAIRVLKSRPAKETRVQKRQPPKATRIRKCRQSVLQTDQNAVPTSPPPDEAAESTMTAPQPPPEQTQAAHHPLKRQPSPQPHPEAGPTSSPDKAAEGTMPAPQPPPKQTQVVHHPLKRQPGPQPHPVVMLMSSDEAAESTITSPKSSLGQLQADYPLNHQPGPQPDPVAMQTSPDEATESAVASPESSPEQQQVDEHPQDAMEFTQDVPYTFWHEEPTNATAQLHPPITMSLQQPQLGQQVRVQAQWDQQSVSQDDMDVDGDQDGCLPDAGAAGSLAESSDRFGDTHAIELATGGDTRGSAHQVGEFETSSPGANLGSWMDLYDEFLEFSQEQWL